MQSFGVFHISERKGRTKFHKPFVLGFGRENA